MSTPSGQRRTDYFEINSPSATSPGALSPFTNHEWGQQPSFSTRYQLRRGSTASSISSIGGSLDTTSHTRLSTLRDSSENGIGHRFSILAVAKHEVIAISTLLQPPIVRTGLLPHTSAPASTAHRPPSTRDIPPVTLTNIPHVEPSVFKSYLAQVGSLYNARARFENEEASTQWFKRERSSSNDEDFAEHRVRHPIGGGDLGQARDSLRCQQYLQWSRLSSKGGGQMEAHLGANLQ